MNQEETGPIPGILSQLGFKKVCLQCKVEAAKQRDGKLKNFNCYNCGSTYDDLGFNNPLLCKKLIGWEFQAKGITLGDKGIDLVYLECMSKKHMPFGTALNLVILSRLGRLSEALA